MNHIKRAVKICGGQAHLATMVDVTQGFVSQLVTGVRPVPPALCQHIEKATRGEVTCEQLRPDVFRGASISAA